jgi:hypothetical protein
MGYDDKNELLGVLDAGLTVRGMDFCQELKALTEETLDGFQRVNGGIDPDLVERVALIDNRLRSLEDILLRAIAEAKVLMKNIAKLKQANAAAVTVPPLTSEEDDVYIPPMDMPDMPPQDSNRSRRSAFVSSKYTNDSILWLFVVKVPFCCCHLWSPYALFSLRI